MNLLEQWESRKRDVEAALVEGRADPGAAATELNHLEYRIRLRPLILKRCKDRKAWRQAQAAKRGAERC